jgi:hypothetical protein
LPPIFVFLCNGEYDQEQEEEKQSSRIIIEYAHVIEKDNEQQEEHQ